MRYFTTPGSYLTHPYEKVDASIRRDDNTFAFRMDGAEMPTNFDKTASDVMAQKYFRKAGVPLNTVRVPEDGVPEFLWRSKPAPATEYGGETSAKQVYHRMVGAWVYAMWRQNYFNGDATAAQDRYEELFDTLQKQMWAPNSPQWFNQGLWWAYGIEGSPQGHFYAVDPHASHAAAEKTVHSDIEVDADGILVARSKNSYQNPQVSACFIQSVSDDLIQEGGIMDLWNREARLFKYGSGTGSNFGKVRGKGEKLSGGGTSSGVMSFLKIGDAAAGSIKSGGTTRRAAKMVILPIDHPDIEDLITWKSREERKVAFLVAGSKTIGPVLKDIHAAALVDSNPSTNRNLRNAMRTAQRLGVPGGAIDGARRWGAEGHASLPMEEYNASWEGEAYQTVSGQNANNSVRIGDDFMAAVRAGREWNLTARTDGKIIKTVNALALEKLIAEAAWQSADPGVQFHDTYNQWNTCPEDGYIEATNPCSEYAWLDDTACNLASINLLRFMRADGSFDCEAFEKMCEIITEVLDITVSASQYPSKKIAVRSIQYRTLGIGYANLGGLLMASGISYDSDAGRGYAAAITALMHGVANRTSADLAGRLGAFPAYRRNAEPMLKVMGMHHRAAHGDTIETNGRKTLGLNPPDGTPGTEVANYARNVWEEVLKLGAQNGFRNAQVSVVAPTGTIGLVMSCDTTGIEPDFAVVKFKTLAGGGYMKIVNRLVPVALKTLGYDDDAIARIEAWALGQKSFNGAPHVTPEKVEGLKTDQWDLEIQLVARGLTKAQAAEVKIYTQGHGTVEGAPDLKPEHLPVFDCANKCGDGTRALSPESHIWMMAACQPFLSGSISKTVNMPAEATVEDIIQIHRLAWETGVKAVAIYRDGSKLSQPLNLSLGEEEEAIADEPDGEDAGRFYTEAEFQDAMTRARNETEAKVRRELTRLGRGKKEALPNRRRQIGQKIKIAGHTIHLTVGEYPDGRPGEIFIRTAKEGSSFRAMLDAFAVLTSKALQHGVPLDELVDAFVGTKFEPAGMVIGHDRIKMATSLLDYVFRELAVSYGGRDDLASGPAISSQTELAEAEVPRAPKRAEQANRPATVEDPREAAANAITQKRKEKLPSRSDLARTAGYTGDMCDNCGNYRMVRNGTCLKCEDCGSTTGCS